MNSRKRMRSEFNLISLSNHFEFKFDQLIWIVNYFNQTLQAKVLLVAKNPKRSSTESSASRRRCSGETLPLALLLFDGLLADAAVERSLQIWSINKSCSCGSDPLLEARIDPPFWKKAPLQKSAFSPLLPLLPPDASFFTESNNFIK